MDYDIYNLFSHDEYLQFAQFLSQNKISGIIKDEIYFKALEVINPEKYNKYIADLKEKNPLKLPFDKLIELLEEKGSILTNKDQKNCLIKISDFFYQKLLPKKISDEMSFAIDKENNNIRITILGAKSYLKIEESFVNNTSKLGYYISKFNTTNFIIEDCQTEGFLTIITYDSKLKDLMSEEVKKISAIEKALNLKSNNKIARAASRAINSDSLKKACLSISSKDRTLMIACELNIFFYTPVKQNTYTMSSCNVKQKEDQKSTYTLYIHSERDMHYVWLSKEIRSIDGVTRIALERTKLESTMHKDTNHIIDLVKTLKNLSLQPLEKKTINMGKHDKENILLERPCAPYKHPDSNIVFKNCDCKGISNSLLINGMPIPEFPQIRHF